MITPSKPILAAAALAAAALALGCDTNDRDTRPTQPQTTGTAQPRATTPATEQPRTIPEQPRIAQPREGQPTQPTAQDVEFLRQAASGGLAEVRLGELATQRAQNPQVRQLGQQMVRDHTRANDRMMDMARSKRVDLPATLLPREQDKLQRLGQTAGAEFDREYLMMMMDSHEMSIELYERTAREAGDPDVRRFAADTLPVLRQHLEHIRRVAQELGVDRDPS